MKTLIISLGLTVLSLGHAQCEAGFRLFDHELLATEPVCIPENPERVLALDMASVETALLTGKNLVGSSGWLLSEFPVLEPRFADRLAGVTDVGFPADLESVLLLEPDVILAVGGTSVGDTVDVAGAGDIAPVVVADPEIYNDWQLGMGFWSDVLGAPEVYAEMARNYDARVAELQDALAQAVGQPGDLEVSVVSASTYGVSLWLPDTPPGSVLADVGLARPEAQSLVGDAAVARFGAAQYVPVSDERLDLAGGDALFYFTYAAADAETARAEADFIGELEQNPLWQALGAVQNEQAFFVGGHWWRAQTYLLANRVLDDLFTHLAGAAAATPVLELP